jgi:glycosyltransferase involved in cell wall biosynthesis
MRSPTLDELPPSPRGKSGWPWTEAPAALPERMPDSWPWPKVSIVTPSYNQGPFLEQTVRSVLLQGYPNLEYIIIDGGSTDESIAILKKYEDWLTYWISEPDEGQSEAINKGFAQASGEIFGWLNSDDLYECNALRLISRYFSNTPKCDLLYGNGWYIDENGQKRKPCSWIKPYNRRLFLTFNFILQPAAFWRRSVWERAGVLDTSCSWAMDWEWFLRATNFTDPHYLPVDLALWRVRSDIKTVYGGWPRRLEIANISRRYGGVWQPTYLVYLLDRMVWLLNRSLGSGSIGRLAQYMLSLFSWILKRTVWRGRQLSEFTPDKI